MIKAFIINDTSNEGHIGSNQVMKNIIRLSEENNIDITGSLTRKEVEKWTPKLESLLGGSELIIINGEGSLHDDPKWFGILNKNRNKFKNHKIVLINSVWQNMGYYDIINQCDIVSFRESKSLEEFNKKYNHNNVKLVADLIFEDYIIYKPIGYGDTVVEQLRDTFKTNINYFPMLNNNSSDTTAYIQWLKTLELYITGRFHGCCLSIIAGTPLLAVESNTHKISGLLQDLGCPERIINDPSDFVLMDNSSYHEKCINYRCNAKDQIQNLFKEIKSL